ncbi:hypothetical protein Acr_20g0007250 [Actinidia rufa]|uniref:Integrase catalytic domain-containing protein n=1 Tax=Actinidia rufa TaxID=165716 RepID=A0A7J0GDM7_9ERIC|nr:hypothetical protein Acr_20g0007250 [Actinidia rufa]
MPLTELKTLLPLGCRYSASLGQQPSPEGDIGMMMTVYQPSSRSMAGSAAYSLTQWLVRPGTCQTVVYPVTGYLAHQGTRHAVSYKASFSFMKRYVFLAIQNNSSGRSHYLCAAARTLSRNQLASALFTTIRPPTTKAALKQRPGRLLPEGEDSRDITIKRLQAQLDEMKQILVDNKLMKQPRIDKGEPSRGKSRGDYSGSMASSKRRVSPCRAQSSMDLRDTLNAKRNLEGDLRKKLNNRIAVALKWFDKLLAGSIESFHQLTESFMARFVINTKALKGVSSLLMLRKGKNESIWNHSKHYWEIYNKIYKCSEEFVVVKMFARLEDDIKQAEKVTGVTARGKGLFKKQKESSVDYESQVRKPESMGGDPKRCNQCWKCSYHDEREHKIENYWALMVFLDQLVRDRHLKEFVNEEKTRAEKDEVRPSPRFDRGDDEADKVLLVQSTVKKPRQAVSKLGSITFTRADLERVQYPYFDPLVIQLRMDNYDVKRILVDTGSLVESPQKGAMKEVQLIEQEHEVLEDVGSDPMAKVVDDLIRYELDEPSSDCFFFTGAKLEERERTELIQFLKANIEVFTWTPYEMPEIDPNFISAPYQRMVMKMFEPILGKIMDTYNNDMVVKSKEKPDYIRDLIQVETERNERRLQGELGEIFGSLGDETRDQGKPRIDYRNQQSRQPNKCEGAEGNNQRTCLGQFCGGVLASSCESRVAREPPQDDETTAIGKTFGGPKVVLEPPQIDPTATWKIFVDGVRNSLGARARARVVLKSLEGTIFEHCLRLNFPTINNEVEYKAFIVGLQSASKLKVPELHIFNDFKLVVNQVTGKFETRRTKMAKYLAMANNLLKEFKAVKIEQVERDSIHMFGIFKAFISDNGTQFIGKKVKDLLYQLKIEFYNSTLSYLQCNGQAEATNKTIMNKIKKKLEKAKGKRVKQLSNVLWTYGTTLRKAMNETPYVLTFRFEAVIPLEVGLPTIQTEAYNVSHNEEVLARDLDLANKRRENMLIRMTDYQKQLAKTYNQKVQHR